MARSTFTPDGDPRLPFAAEDIPGDAKGRKMFGVVLYDGSGNPITAFGGGGGGGVAFTEGQAVTGGTPAMWKDGSGNGLVASTANPLPTQIVGTLDFPNPLPTVGTVVPVSASFARPADTNAYAAGDAVSNSTSAPAVMTFAGAARVGGGGGYVVGLRLMMGSATVTGASFRVHLYHTAPTAVNDNAAFPLLIANRAKRIGIVEVSCVTSGTGSDAAEGGDPTIRLPFVCDVASTTIYGAIEALASYAPGNAALVFVELMVEQY